MIIKSYVGNHDIAIYKNCTYDPSIRKYRGGERIAVIPYSGRKLSAYSTPQKELSPLQFDDSAIPLRSSMEWTSIDPIPDKEECDYAIVSLMYVTACKALGVDTSRLLTVGGTVVDEHNHVIGTCWLTKN